MTKRCNCGATLEPIILKSRAGKEVRWICPNAWSDDEHFAVDATAKGDR